MFKKRAVEKPAMTIWNRSRKSGVNPYVRMVTVMLLLTCVAVMGIVWLGPRANASNPATGTLSPASTQVTWVGTATGGSVPNAPLVLGGETACVEGLNCETFTLTLSGTPAEWAAAQKAVHIHIGWQLPATDYDLYVHKGDLTGDVIANSGRGATSPTGPLTSEDTDLDPSNPDIGTGSFAVHVVYYNATAADQYSGVASVFDQAPPPPPTPPTPISSETAPGFINYADPNQHEWGEPSLGVNHKTNNAMLVSSLTTLRISFDDTQSPATATWTDTSFPLTSLITWDPILFTDSQTGRTFVSQLQFPSKQSTTAFTDDDGANWLPSQGSAINAGVDHQTIGGGPFHDPLTRDPNGALYPNAVYYAAQDLVTAEIGVSYDGGMTFGPAVPMYTTECVGIHGHIKVAPDGTVYVPNRGCGGQQGMLVSKDNGITWQIKLIPGSHPSTTDPSIGVGADGTVYFGYADSNRTPRMAVYNPQTDQWISDYPVGGSTVFTGVAFPAVIAGDGDRAAFAFLGTTASGIPFGSGTSFTGVWHLYVATTYDRGVSYTISDATPTDPVQRGNICDEGSGCPSTPRNTRNLLDFMDVQIDNRGRIVVGYADGCLSAACIAGRDVNGNAGVPDGRVNSFDNDGRAVASISRQVSGKTLFKAFDSGQPTPTPTPSPTATPTPTPPGLVPAPADAGPKVGFQNFEAPGTLVNVTSTSQGPGAKTVEYLGHDAGEPSIGNNWKSGVTSYQSDLQTLFVTFNDNCPSGSPATWVNRPAPTSQFVDSDPIGFTDRYTGRTFAGELTLTSPSCKTSFTDDDGQTWVVSQGSGLGASVDHETIGGGPFHTPLTRPTNVTGLYPDAVYYCSQLPAAACARSDDGGLTFGPAVEVDPVADGHCGGLHGHLKVAPDGTVYLPFSYCDAQGATIVSEDNGVTWTIKHVPNTVSSSAAGSNIQDPAVGVDNNGRAYFGMASGIDKNITKAVVATTDDHGATWQNVYDVGAAYGLSNIAYPAAVAADPGRAAVAFYGTTTAGDESANGFKGVWHLYIAETFDGGAHWTTNDATPNAPIQRGCIWMHGGVNICRNLLDFFDMTVDSQGRVEVGYVNGCAGGNCAQSSASANGNAYTATATIARQSSGRRLVAAFDPPNALTATSVPGMPSVTTRRIGNTVHLGWSEADDGNSAISGYRIMRGTASGAETLLTTVPGTQTLYDDTSATDTSKTYYYKVLATNAVGASCGANEVAAPYVGDTCGGLIVQRNDPSHPESLIAAQNPSLAIDYVAVGEPPATNNFMFKLKVSNLASVPANSRWRVVWNTEASSGQQFYAGMTTAASGAPTFDYGVVATGSIPPVIGLIGVPQETSLGAALPGSNYNADGTITIYVPKSAVGNPQPGDLLGAVNGRTFTGDTPGTANLERSTLLIDHTFVKAQRDNGSPAATYTVAGNNNCSPFIEQIVNSLVSLQASNPIVTTGKSAFDLAIKNTSGQSIFTPLQAEVAQLASTSGKVTVANADNGQTGTSALWSYDNNIGSDNTLSASEVSSVRNLKFNNPNNEAFTVTFNVVGTIAQTSSSSSGGTSGGGGSGSSSSSSNTSSVTAPLGTMTNMVLQVTYNPVLKTVTVKLK